MNSTNQTNKFTRFLKNNAALLLIIFCVLAIGTVVLVVSLTSNNVVEPDSPVVVDPDVDQPTVTPDDGNPTTPKTEIVKVYFASPVDYESVSMSYTDGTNEIFVFNKTLNYWTTHNALDLAAADGADVCAMYDGTVLDVSESYGMGNIVTIDHGDNVIATYASLGDVTVTKGQTVAKGEKIGEVSSTASFEFSDGAHLHLEVAVDGNNVDPTAYVNGEIYREVEQTVSE